MSNIMSNTEGSAGASPAAERLIDGVGVAPGVAIGKAHRYSLSTPEVEPAQIESNEVETELDLLEGALDQAGREMEKVRSLAEEKLGAKSEAIFEAQEMMLQDEEVLQPIRRRIREQHDSAAYALSDVLRTHRRRLETSDDPYLRDRATDLEDLESRLLRALHRGKTAATIEPNSIVVADRLTAADLLRFSRHGLLGCVTSGGGPTSHVSIIARALDLPAVVGAEGVTEVVNHGDMMILDGLKGRLIVRPSDETLQDYRQRKRQYEAQADARAHLATEPAETTDGHRLTLRANVGFGEALDALGQYGAEGIGLLRTEMLFLGAETDPLTEERQYEVYRRAATATDPHGATVRLFDLGGDKLVPFADKEDNPFLGWRGIRVLLDRPDELLRPQLRALLRANAHGSVRLLIPMVTGLDEIQEVRVVLREEAERLDQDDVRHDSSIDVGVMVEVPAVALQAPLFAEAADFLSIGTNDLSQYVLAVDRGNDLVASRYDDYHPAVLQLVRRTVKAGEETNTPVTLCGEIASDVQAVPLLVGLGLQTLSLAPPYLPAVKRMVRAVSLSDVQGLAREACAAPDAQSVRERTRTWIEDHVDSEVVTVPR